MKRYSIKVILIILLFVIIEIVGTPLCVLGSAPGAPGEVAGSDGSGGGSDGSWVSEAFSAAKSFLKNEQQDELGVVNPILTFFKNLVKGVNLVLLVALAGISAIALSVTGVRYIMAAGMPAQRQIALNNLKTVFIGMAYGFGAFVIWKIAMGIVSIIIESF